MSHRLSPSSDPRVLEQTNSDGLLETHVLCPLDRQPVPGVVVYHLGDGKEPAFEVTQLEIPIHRVAPNSHVHVASRAPVGNKNVFFNSMPKKDIV